VFSGAGGVRRLLIPPGLAISDSGVLLGRNDSGMGWAFQGAVWDQTPRRRDPVRPARVEAGRTFRERGWSAVRPRLPFRRGSKPVRPRPRGSEWLGSGVPYHQDGRVRIRSERGGRHPRVGKRDNRPGAEGPRAADMIHLPMHHLARSGLGFWRAVFRRPPGG